MNKTQLIGRLTKDIDLRYTQNQMAFGRFTLAVPRIKKDETDFISCKVWGKKAEAMEKYVKKGHKVCIAGRIETGSYLKGDQRVYTTDVVVEDFDFIETKGSDIPCDAPGDLPEDFVPVSDPDLPF